MDGKLEVTHNYHFYKQICRAGQPGMAVAGTASDDTEVGASFRYAAPVGSATLFGV